MPVSSWSPTAASNTGILTGITLDGSSMNVPLLDDAFREMGAQIAAQLGRVGFKGSDLPSAATTDLSTATGWYCDVTGTTTITGFGTVAAGQVFILRFASSLTLTHNASTLILPGAVNITTTGGDTAIMISLGGGAWRCLSYQPIAGFGNVVRIQTFSASGTYTPHANMVSCIIEAVGGGGGGGGVQGASNSILLAGGGGSGSYSRTVASRVAIGASQVVTIGAAGTAGAAGSGNGGAGGTTSVGSLCVAYGGAGGAFSSGAPAVGLGGTGGIVGIGTVTMRGNPGSGGFLGTSITAIAYGSEGGASFFGGAGRQSEGGTTGSGGGGASTSIVANIAGGIGGAGYVVITEQCSG